MAISIWLLAVGALIALAADIFNPFANFLFKYRGKSNGDLGKNIEKNFYKFDADGKKVLDEDGDPEVNWGKAVRKGGPWVVSCCFWGLFVYPITLAITFVLEPIAAFQAILNHIGNVYLAYAALAIIFITLISTLWTWGSMISNAFKESTDSKKPGPNASEEEKWKYEFEQAAKAAKPVVTGSSLFWSFCRRVFFALPDVYLVYLIVMIFISK